MGALPRWYPPQGTRASAYPEGYARCRLRSRQNPAGRRASVRWCPPMGLCSSLPALALQASFITQAASDIHDATTCARLWLVDRLRITCTSSAAHRSFRARTALGRNRPPARAAGRTRAACPVSWRWRGADSRAAASRTTTIFATCRSKPDRPPELTRAGSLGTPSKG